MQKPMKYNINYSPKALQDLDEIWDYISKELSNPDAAEHVVTSILDAVDVLGEFPESGAPLEPHINLDSPYRFVTASNYIAFYRFEENTVYVDRVLYQKRNYAKLLSL